MVWIAWLALIFGTSCTVIRPQEFFELVAAATGADAASMQRFELFWGVAWYGVVKGWHVTEFALLTGFSMATWRWWCGSLTPRGILAAMLFALAFAISDEWHQAYIPDRYGTVEDVIIDSLGIALAGLIALARLRRRGTNCRTRAA
jgi:hypothetical protein